MISKTLSGFSRSALRIFSRSLMTPDSIFLLTDFPLLRLVHAWRKANLRMRSFNPLLSSDIAKYHAPVALPVIPCPAPPNLRRPVRYPFRAHHCLYRGDTRVSTTKCQQPGTGLSDRRPFRLTLPGSVSTRVALAGPRPSRPAYCYHRCSGGILSSIGTIIQGRGICRLLLRQSRLQ